MQTPLKRIAVNFGGGYVPGLNAVITGAVLAASELGWEVVGIRDGFDGLLFPDRYPEGGLVKLTPQSWRTSPALPAASWAPRPEAIPSTSAPSTRRIWSRRWTGPMSFWG